MRAESWKPVVGYQGLYEVSDCGRVRGLMFINNRVTKPRQTPKVIRPAMRNGYRVVNLSKSGKATMLSVARLVLCAFVGPCPPGHEAAHLDGDALNDALQNLQWCTRTANHAHKKLHGTINAGERCPRAKLTASQVAEIRALLAAGETHAAIAARYGVKKVAIGYINRGITWRLA